MSSGKLASLCAFVTVAAATFLFGCLDADPLRPGGNGAALNVELVYLTEGGAAKRVDVDSIRIALYDVTADPYTASPAQFDLAAEESAPAHVDDATGVHYLARLQVELSDRRTYRVMAFLSVEGGGDYDGERTLSLSPNDEASITLVMTGSGAVPADSFDLAVPKTVGSPGDTVEIPVVLLNSDSLGGIQFQLEFDRDVLDTVMGIRVDPASRLFVDPGDGDPTQIFGHLASTDSTARVVVVDLTAGGADPPEPLRPITPGNDLLLFLVVTLRDDLAGLPDTMDLLLQDVFFSTVSGSSDIAVPDPTGGRLIITE